MPRPRDRRTPRKRRDVDLLVTLVVAEMISDPPRGKPPQEPSGGIAASPPAANRPAPRHRR